MLDCRYADTIATFRTVEIYAKPSEPTKVIEERHKNGQETKYCVDG
jgi:hypothetical protein